MNRIERSYRFDRERSFGRFQDVIADRHPMPMRADSREQAAAIRQSSPLAPISVQQLLSGRAPKQPA
jgi:hypothetical protein